MRMKEPIIDLHCDLLSYLAEDSARTPYDPESRASLLQLRQGGVVLQVLALFTETKKGSSHQGAKQIEIFSTLKGSIEPEFRLAIENASGLIEEDEPLSELFSRLEALQKESGPIAYLSLTWNSENRFGGGNHTKVGLKREGELLLDKLSELKIPIDLSHTSDQLAHDILNTIDKSSLSSIPIASHSNFRKVRNVPRNLPEEFAREIGRRGGIIGLNLFAHFIGPNFNYLIKHIEEAKRLSLLDHLAFGADFFGGLNLATLSHYPQPLFFEEANDAGCYQEILKRVPFSAKKIASANARKFLR